MPANYPFGTPLRDVVQTDRTAKNVFVLGVYSSAVHARWLGPDGKTRIMALAVAPEPYIFWRGDGVEEILATIPVPPGAGRLVPAATRLNGPSGQVLDDHVLAPLGLTRETVWLCDLVPHTCLNPRQKAALARTYEPLRADLHLPPVTLPDVPKQFADAARREEVLREIYESNADTLILLGDQPIRHFLRHYDARFRKLSDFGERRVVRGAQVSGAAARARAPDWRARSALPEVVRAASHLGERCGAYARARRA